MKPRTRAAALFVALTVGGHVLAQQTPAFTPVDAELDALVRGALPRDARVGIVVMEASSGQIVYQHDPDVSLNPASNAKVLTAAAALSIVGPSHRFATGLYGELRANGAVQRLVLQGEGDPSLRTSDLYDLARQAWILGLRRVDRELVVDDSRFGDRHLPPGFEQQPRESAPFRASVGAVSVDENTLTVHLRPGATVGAAALITTSPPGYLSLENTVTTAQGGHPSVAITVATDPDGRERARVSGNVALGAAPESYTRRLDNPGLAAGYAMRSALEAVGVRVRGVVRVGVSATSASNRLARHESQPLSALLYEVGKDSNNFTAEMTLLAVAAAPEEGVRHAPVSFERGAERVIDWARRAGVATEGMVVRNGSGLFDSNRLSARQIAQTLAATWRDPALREEYIAQLAVGGDDGTLRNRLRLDGATRRVRAKTGTLDDAIALSGYVLTREPGRALIFSYLSNGVRGHTAEARALADAIVTALTRRAR